MARRARSALSSLGWGLACTAAFGFMFLDGHQWAIFPMVFAGVMPLVSGLVGLPRRLIRAREAAPPRQNRERLAEQAILRAAQRDRGRVTPATVALASDLSMEEAEKRLTDMARKGYASLQVRDDGRVEYEFAEFLSLEDDAQERGSQAGRLPD